MQYINNVSSLQQTITINHQLAKELANRLQMYYSYNCYNIIIN